MEHFQDRDTELVSKRWDQGFDRYEYEIDITLCHLLTGECGYKTHVRISNTLCMVRRRDS